MLGTETMRLSFSCALLLMFIAVSCSAASAQTTRVLSGTVITANNEAVEGASVTARYPSGEQKATTDAEGSFRLAIPLEPFTLKVEGKNIVAQEKQFEIGPVENLRIEIQYIIPPVHETVLIVASHLDPVIDRRNDAVYSGTLFSRDDQLFHTLDAGISAGQHEGGGKSVEGPRFGFNLDPGGFV